MAPERQMAGHDGNSQISGAELTRACNTQSEESKHFRAVCKCCFMSGLDEEAGRSAVVEHTNEALQCVATWIPHNPDSIDALDLHSRTISEDAFDALTSISNVACQLDV
jgi:hypothetical protein